MRRTTIALVVAIYSSVSPSLADSSSVNNLASISDSAEPTTRPLIPYELWQATIDHAEGFQSETQKMGKSDATKVRQAILRAVEPSLRMVVEPSPTSYPSEPPYFGTGTFMTSCGYGSFLDLLKHQFKELKLKPERVSQTDAIILFDSIRRSADTLMDAFYQYVAKSKELASKSARVETVDATDTSTADLRKEVAAYRCRLVALAGTEAIDNLDKQLSAKATGN